MTLRFQELGLMALAGFGLACSSAHTAPMIDAATDAADGGVVDSHVFDSGDDAADSAVDSSVPSMDAMIDSGVDAADACAPDCGGRTCGEDHCGGVCGPVCEIGVESFEGFPGGPTFSATPFTFDSGLEWLAPFPNRETAAIYNCVDNGGFFGFLCADSADLIPDGTSLLIMDGLLNRDKRFEFRFPGLVKSVSVAVTDTTGTEDEIFQMEAFDASGAVVGRDSIVSGAVANWASNRLSITVATPVITRIAMFSDGARVLSMDDMRWE